MSDLVVRRLLIDLETPPARHWMAGDAFLTAYFNALSMSFPVGEQFFIDSVRLGLAQLPPEQRARFEPEVRGFIGQEATHRRVHQRFNAHLEQQGLVNEWQVRITQRLRRLEGVDARAWVALTAATEHFTAILAEHMLAHREQMQGTEERLQTMWLWHASEETEHRSVAFDLYRALGGSERWRLRLFHYVTFRFLTDLMLQTWRNLRRDGTLWQRSTWASGWRFVFGRGGLVRELSGPWARYRRADFHPDQQNAEPALGWLRAHADVAVPVGGVASRSAA
ncbi:MAG: metal-dependent hydrolase [Ideonella sp.]|nr:metal-dependent hydrolase [Ideonella sp.]